MGSSRGVENTPKTYDLNPLSNVTNIQRSPFDSTVGNGLMQGQQLYDLPFQMKAMENQQLR